LGGGHVGGLVRTGSHDLQSVLPKVDPTVAMLGSFQNNNNDHFMNSREVYDDDYKHEHWDEEAPGTPRFAANGYYSETDVGMVGDRDNDDHLQQPLLGGSNYGSARYGNITPRGRYVSTLISPSNYYFISFEAECQEFFWVKSGLNCFWFDSQCRINHSFFTPRLSRQSSRNSNYDGAVPESLGSVDVGGGWQLAWQKDGEEGALKRVYLKSEAGDLSNVTQTLSGLPAFGNFSGDQESFPVNSWTCHCIILVLGVVALIDI
jgi:hypothetical protein